MGMTATTGSIDVQGIVSQLMSVERQPLQAINKRIAGVDTKISAIGKVKSALSTLQTAARGLTNVDTWRAASATSSDDKSVGVTVTSGAPAGNFPIRVDQLARPQSAISGKFDAATTVVGGGTLTIQMGSWDETGKTFTADATRTAATVTLPDGATLTQARDAINAAAAGVTATLVNDGGKVRLMLRGTDTGASNAFSIAGTGAGGAQLTVDPAGTGAVPVTQSALDAKYNLAGVDMTAAGNTVTNAVDGISLSLRKVGLDPVEIQVARNTDAMRKAVDTFVSAYNDTQKAIADQTKYDPSGKTAGTLQGSSVLVGLQTKLREIVTATVGTGTLSRLSNAGIEVQRDGSLSVNDTKYKQAAADPTALSTLLANTDAAVPGNVGLARRLDTLLTRTMGTDGSLAGSLDTLQSTKRRLSDQTDRINRQLVQTEKRLTKLYSTLDQNLSSMSSATQYLSKLGNTGNGNGG